MFGQGSVTSFQQSVAYTYTTGTDSSAGAPITSAPGTNQIYYGDPPPLHWRLGDNVYPWFGDPPQHPYGVPWNPPPYDGRPWLPQPAPQPVHEPPAREEPKKPKPAPVKEPEKPAKRGEAIKPLPV